MTKLRRISIGIAVGSFCLAVGARWGLAQTGGAEAPQPEVVLTKLVGPTYPPLARAAHIAGDVKVNVHVRADGSVASVELFSGHPILAPAAVESATKSEYECTGCAGEMSYQLTYTFAFIDDMTPYNKIEERPTRAAKCLYLWKCGIVRVNTFDWCTANVPPQITQSPRHVKILVFPVCVEVESSVSASR
jgi:TonB family protein